MSSSLEDVGKSPGGDAIVSFLRVSHNDDGSEKGGSASTLAQVLANGHDANALQINNLADPTNPQDAATKNYVDTHSAASPLTTKGDLYTHSSVDTRLAVGAQGYYLVSDSGQTAGLGWGRPLGAIDVTKEYGVSTSASAASNATNLQAALDAAGGLPVIIPGSASSYSFSSTLTLNQEQWIVGHGVNGGTLGTTLNYTGADATNGIASKSNGLSRVRLEGFRLIDGRTSPTSGDGIHLDGVKNGVIIRSLLSSFSTTASAGRGIYIGASASTTEVVHVEDVWVGGGLYGLQIEKLDNQAFLHGISGDANGGGKTMVALIHLNTITAGQSVVVVQAAKLETNNGCHVLDLASDALCAVSAHGLVMRGPTQFLGGDVIHSAATNVNLIATAISSQPGFTTGPGVVAANLINDTAASVTYGTGKRNLPLMVLSNAGASGTAMQFQYGMSKKFQAISANTTIDPTHYGLLITTGASDQTMTLPAVATDKGRELVFVKVDSGVGHVVIDGNGSETINGALTLTLSAQYDKATIVSDGTAWYQVA